MVSRQWVQADGKTVAALSPDDHVQWVQQLVDLLTPLAYEVGNDDAS